MKSRIIRRLGLLLAVALVIPAGPALAGGSAPKSPLISVNWQFGVASPFGGTRFDGEYVSNNRRIYFLGFRTFGDLTDGSVWYYDTVAGTYTDTGVDMPVPVSNYQIAPLNDANGLGLYIFGGRDSAGAIVTTVQVYRPATNTASIVSTDPWPGKTPSNCVSLPAMGVATVANRAFVLGGLSFSANGCVDDQSTQTWVFNPASPAGSRWTPGRPLNVARGYITPAVVNNTIYAIGGDTNQAGTLFPSATVEAWHPPAGGWNDAGVADLPVACDEGQAFSGFRQNALRSTIVFAGCGQWPAATPDTYIYDAVANTWTLGGAFNEPRRNHAGAMIVTNGRPTLFILGGYDCPGNACLADPTQTSEVGQVGPISGAPAGTSARGGRPDRAPSTS